MEAPFEEGRSPEAAVVPPNMEGWTHTAAAYCSRKRPVNFFFVCIEDSVRALGAKSRYFPTFVISH
jgi:hypothetical protein